nr:cyclodeaminase/cyclohydrolase family protein [Micromonospora sp. DSM 115978]
MGIDSDSVGGFLSDLASGEPAPGGGAAAAMQVALGAALVSMVCNLTIGKPKYAAYETEMTAVLETAEALRTTALSTAEADAEAFTAVRAAHQLPKDTAEQRQRRAEAVHQALLRATAVPLWTAGLAAEVVHLCQRILPGANVNVLSDVGVAACCARAGLMSAAVNVRVNLAAMTDPTTWADTQKELATRLATLPTADEVVRAVEERIGT